jgi:hypothetical protein
MVFNYAVRQPAADQTGAAIAVLRKRPDFFPRIERHLSNALPATIDLAANQGSKSNP